VREKGETQDGNERSLCVGSRRKIAISNGPQTGCEVVKTLRRNVKSDEGDNDEGEDEDGDGDGDPRVCHRQSHATIHRGNY
jgi:hypothetical protein